jgi:O-antigen/teichoic acid export membrane protein
LKVSFILIKTEIYLFVVRLCVLLIKFFFVIFLLKNIGIVDYGRYVFIVALSVYSVYLVGLDLSSANQKRFIKSLKYERGEILKTQFSLHLLIYPALFIFLLLFLRDDYPGEVYLLLLFLIIFEQISQEIFRYLVSLKKNIESTNVFLIRHGLWPICIIVFFQEGQELEITDILLFWLLFSILSVIVGIRYFVKEIEFTISLNGFFDFISIRKMFKGALLLFASTLFGVFFSVGDKILVRWIFDFQILGVYAFFSSIAIIIPTMTHFVITNSMIGRLMELYISKDMHEYSLLKKEMFVKIIIMSVLLSLVMILALDYLLLYLKKSELMQSTNLFYYVVISNVVIALNQIFWIDLFIASKYKELLYGNVMPIILLLFFSYFIYNNNLDIYHFSILITLCLFVQTFSFYFYKKKCL